MLVEAAVGPIHSAVLGLLVGHNPVEAALGPTVLAVLAEAALGPIHSAALVKTALGPPALAVLVDAALGPIHSAALVETAVGPIHGAVLRRSPSPALPVEPAFGRLLGDAIGNQVGVASDVPAEAALVDAVQRSTSRSGAALAVTVEAALGRLFSAQHSASWPPTFSLARGSSRGTVRGTGCAATAGGAMTTTAAVSTGDLFWVTMLAVIMVVFKEIEKGEFLMLVDFWFSTYFARVGRNC